MENKYAILSYHGDPFDALGSDIVKNLTGVNELLLDISSAINWLLHNTQGVLIVSMPIEEEQRQSIANNLREIETRCIAIDPAQLKVGSRPLFKVTQPVNGSVFLQIKGLMATYGIKKD